MSIRTLRVFSVTVLECAVAVLLINAFWAQAVDAAELVSPPVTPPPNNYAMRAGTLYTDNIDRIPFDEREELVGIVEFDGYTSYEGPRFTGFFQSSLGYRVYTLNRYDDEPRATLLGSGKWMIIPRTLSWSASELLTNAPVDPLENASPSNIQFINAFETGPGLTTRIGSSQALDVAALYTIVKAEDTLIDHSRETALLDWRSNLSTRRSIGLSLSASRTDFDNDQLNTDFDQATAFITYLSNTERVDVDFAVGKSRVRSVITDFEEDYETGRLRVDAQRTSQSSLNLSLSREITDTSAALFDVARNQQRLTPQVVVGEPYLGENATLQYTRGPEELYWSLFAGWSRIDFFEFDPLVTTGNPLDQLQRRAGLTIFAKLNSRLNATGTAIYSDVDYLNSTRIDDLRAFTLGFEYQMDRRWSLLLNLSRYETVSTDPTQSFTEHQALFALQYAVRGVR
jgi:hypothetical protein